MLSEEFKNKVLQIIKEVPKEYDDINLIHLIENSFDQEIFSVEESIYIYEQVYKLF